MTVTYFTKCFPVDRRCKKSWLVLKLWTCVNIFPECIRWEVKRRVRWVHTCWNGILFAAVESVNLKLNRKRHNIAMLRLKLINKLNKQVWPVSVCFCFNFPSKYLWITNKLSYMHLKQILRHAVWIKIFQSQKLAHVFYL